jgi:hypothetical protein
MYLRRNFLCWMLICCPGVLALGQRKQLLSSRDLVFLSGMVKDVMEASRIYANQKISDDFGPNQTGGTLIRPGGRTSYPAFWIRDYAMSIETGYVTEQEQAHMLFLTAQSQADQTIVTKWGTQIPKGSIADHIRIDDGKSIYFPGTYSYENQGETKWGMQPPLCDQFFFIQMAYFYTKYFSKSDHLRQEIKGMKLIDRLELAYRMPPVDSLTKLVEVQDDNRGVDFGFRDAIYMTGKLCYTSILKYQAAKQMAYLMRELGEVGKSEHYKQEASSLQNAILNTFVDKDGMLRASTGRSAQPDVWATALAVHVGILTGLDKRKVAKHLRSAYLKGSMSQRGNIRHVLSSDDFSGTTAWERSLVAVNTYQNGAYWGTPTGWVCEAIASIDLKLARKLAKQYMQDLRVGDFRKGEKFGAPWECFHLGLSQNPVYLTTVAVPFISFKNQ